VIQWLWASGLSWWS